MSSPDKIFAAPRKCFQPPEIYAKSAIQSSRLTNPGSPNGPGVIVCI
jgi:hypothetical protein